MIPSSVSSSKIFASCRSWIFVSKMVLLSISLSRKFFKAYTTIGFNVANKDVVPMSLLNLFFFLIVHIIQIFHVVIMLLKEIHDKIADRLLRTLFACVIVCLLSQPWCLFNS